MYSSSDVEGKSNLFSSNHEKGWANWQQTVVVVVVAEEIVVAAAVVVAAVVTAVLVTAVVVAAEKKILFFTLPWVVLFSDSGLYQSPESLRTLRRSCAVSRRALFCSSTSLIIPGIWASQSGNLSASATSAPTTTGDHHDFEFPRLI